MQQTTRLALIGSAGGLFGSMLGLGGGLVTIPLLTRVARFSQHSANATSLAAVVATSAGATYSHWKNGNVDFWQALPLTAGALLSVSAGASLAARLDEKRLGVAFGVFMIFVAPMVPLKDKILEFQSRPLVVGKSSGDGVPSPSQVTAKNALTEFAELCEKNPAIQQATSFSIGLFSGLTAGLFGIGGGAIQVPAIGLVSHLSQQEIIATSLAAMFIPATVGAFKHYRNGFISPRLAAPVVAGTFIGSYLGGEVSNHVPEEALKWAFAAVMMLTGFKQVVR